MVHLANKFGALTEFQNEIGSVVRTRCVSVCFHPSKKRFLTLDSVSAMQFITIVYFTVILLLLFFPPSTFGILLIQGGERPANCYHGTLQFERSRACAIL